MEWLALFFFAPFFITIYCIDWLVEKYIRVKDPEQLSEGEKMISENRYLEAQNFFNEKLKRFPKSAKAYRLRGKVNLKLANYYSSIYDLEQSISYDNTVAESYVLKGKAFYKLEEFDKAFLEFDKADWFYRNENAEVLRWRGMARYAIGQLENAINDFKKAVDLGDEDADYILKTKFDYLKK
jgi:tetratricopeptide (TPR) repeat protein